MISVAADQVNLSNGTAQYQVPVTGATPFTPAWTALSTLAGDGLVFTSAQFNVNVGNGLEIATDMVQVDLVAAWSGLEFSGGDLRVDLDTEHTWTAAHTFSSTVTVAEYIYHSNDEDTYLQFQPDRITLRAGDVDMIDIVEGTTDYVNFPAGLLYINETSNANMAIGLTINQGANDDEILALKSSDVAHGATAVAETDTFAQFLKVGGTSGGLEIRGLKDSDGANNGALRLLGGLAEDVNTTKSTSGLGIIDIYALQISGTGYGDTVADGNLLAIRTRRSGAYETIVIVDEDGDIYYDGSLQNYDDEDDALAAWDLSHVLAGAWEQVIEYNRDRLAAMGVIAVGKDGGIMVSNKRLSALLMGAVGQLYQRVQRAESALVGMGVNPALLEVN